MQHAVVIEEGEASEHVPAVAGQNTLLGRTESPQEVLERPGRRLLQVDRNGHGDAAASASARDVAWPVGT